MALLAPVTAIVAAALAIPLLIALYILKLRRRPYRIASTMLWRQAFDDLKVNVPFRRLRSSVLLVLQLLALACIILALGEPVGPADGAALGSRVVILVDRSASMSTIVDRHRSDGPRTRLDLARERALDVIDKLERGGVAPSVTVLAFGSAPTVVAGFGTPMAELRRAIEGIAPSDEQGDLAAALDLASIFAAGGDETGAVSPPDVVVISDGVVHRDKYGARAGRVRHERIGSPDDAGANDNVGIVDFGARRDRDDPSQVAVFARLASARERDSEIALELRLDGRVVRAAAIAIPGATASGPGVARAAFEIDAPDGGVFSAHLGVDDRLRSDDVAALVMPPPVRPRVAMVYGGSEADPELVSIVDALEPGSRRAYGPESWNGLDPIDVDLGRTADLVIFDRVAPERLPGIPSVTFGAVPRGFDVVEGADLDLGRRVLAWDRVHPLLRNVALDALVYRRFGAFVPGPGATPLVFGPEGPVALVTRSRSAEHVVVGFALEESNWPLDLSFAVFMQNVFDHLLLGRAGAARITRPGEPVVVQSDERAGTITVTGPGFETPRSITARPAAPVTLPRLTRAGVYRVVGAVDSDAIVAASVLSMVETDIVPRDLSVAALEADRATAGASGRRDLRPWFVLIAIVVLTLEWLVYCRRIAIG